MKKQATTILTLLSFLILFSLIVSAQTKTFKWEQGLCEFEGSYDAGKYTEQQLRDTQKLLSSIGSLSLDYDATPRNFAGVEKLSLTKLESEYRKTLNELQNLNLVKDEIWEELRQNKIKELNQLYMLSKVTVKGYKNPAALREFKKAEPCANFYAQPLIDSGEYLLTTWKKVNMDTRSRNGNPRRIEGIFNRQNASPDRFKYAQIEVMTFGWWNCANGMRYHLKHDEKYAKSFNKLFSNVKTICDEP